MRRTRLPGQLADPRVKDACRIANAACNGHYKRPGKRCLHDQLLMEKYIVCGRRTISGGGDFSFLLAGSKARMVLLCDVK